MGILGAINRSDKRIGWSLLGFFLAAIFGAVSIYTEFIRDRRPQLRFEIITDASVLDVREQLGNLEIIYDGRDIKKAKESLRVVVIRITNEGATDVLIGHYDQRSPLGFKVSGGNLLRAELLSASSQYLRQTLRIDTSLRDTAIFTPVIVESNEWFTVKSLILLSEGSRPSFQAVGKIASVREIRIIDSTQTVANRGFLATAFSGGAWVQVARFAADSSGFIVLFVAGVFSVQALSTYFGKRRRRKHIDQFKSLSKRAPTKWEEYMFERYIERGKPYVRMLARESSDEDQINKLVRQHQQVPGVESKSEDQRSQVAAILPPDVFGLAWEIADLINLGFVCEREGRWHVDPQSATTLKEFVRFLRRKR